MGKGSKALTAQELTRLHEDWERVAGRILDQAGRTSEVLGEEFSQWWERLLEEDYMDMYRIPGYELGKKTIILEPAKPVQLSLFSTYLDECGRDA